MAGLQSIDHVILVMLENRSFDHLLGFLYPKSKDFDGLDGTESTATLPAPRCRSSRSRRKPRMPTTSRWRTPPKGLSRPTSSYSVPPLPPPTGKPLTTGSSPASPANSPIPHIRSTQARRCPTLVHHGMYAPETLPVLCGLAKGFAVCGSLVRIGSDADLPQPGLRGCRHVAGLHDNSARDTPAFDTPSVFGKLATPGTPGRSTAIPRAR